VQEGFLKTNLGEGFAVIGEPVYDPALHGAGAGIAVRKGDDELRQRLDAAIQAIRADGTYKRINDHYFDFDLYGD
jgi:arginine/ornithine transport system substrate-binding protein